MRVVAMPRVLRRVWRPFRDCFSAAQCGHFQRYVLGLIVGREGRNVQDITALYPDAPDQASLNHFLTVSP